jgi:hypothetical protein
MYLMVVWMFEWHVALDIRQPPNLDRQRPEGVAQIVEAQLREARLLKRLDVAFPQLRLVQRPADDVHEDEYVGRREVLTTAPDKRRGRVTDCRAQPQ